MGALVKGGIGPDDVELGVEAPDEPGDDAGVFRRDDFAILYVCYPVQGGLQYIGIVSGNRGLLCQDFLAAQAVFCIESRRRG